MQTLHDATPLDSTVAWEEAVETSVVLDNKRNPVRLSATSDLDSSLKIDDCSLFAPSDDAIPSAPK